MFERKRILEWVGLLFGSVVWVLVLVFAGCSDPNTRPNPEVADSTFANVLAEMQFIRAREEIKDDIDLAIEDSVLIRYGLARTDYEAILGYFSQNPDEFRDVLESVVEILEEARIPAENSQRTE